MASTPALLPANVSNIDNLQVDCSSDMSLSIGPTVSLIQGNSRFFHVYTDSYITGIVLN